MLNIACVIVTYNISEDFFKVVNSVYKQVKKVIIVDNSSNDSSKKILKSVKEKYDLDIIYNSENLGIAKALNIGVKAAVEFGADWVLTLDHDSILEDKMIYNMMELYENEIKDKESVAILAPEILDVSINKSYYKINENLRYKELNHVIQSGSLIKSDIFNEIGYFNEELFIYFVDIDFCYEVTKSGYKILMIKNATLFHEEGKKEKRKFLGMYFTYDNYSIQAIYYISRNAIYMLKKYRKFEFIKRVIYDSIKILLAEPKKIKYVFIGVKDSIIGKYGNKFVN